MTGELLASLESDGTLAGSRVILNGVEIEHVTAVDLRIDDRGAVLHISVGVAVIDVGEPGRVSIERARARLSPTPTPRE